ncbi:hypothetical protein APSETT444_007942 [Aspergillus pseudonomiae]
MSQAHPNQLRKAGKIPRMQPEPTDTDPMVSEHPIDAPERRVPDLLTTPNFNSGIRGREFCPGRILGLGLNISSKKPGHEGKAGPWRRISYELIDCKSRAPDHQIFAEGERHAVVPARKYTRVA